VAADLGAVGEEVSTVLKSAQEAAAQIRQKAQEEAERRTQGGRVYGRG
jgi:F0F1-type ATP synthase membrane subunit b/b'